MFLQDLWKHDQRPIHRLLGILLMKLPFDVGNRLPVKIKTYDFHIRLHQSARSVGLWHTPNNRSSDYEFITTYLKEGDTYIDVGANIGTLVIPGAKTVGPSGKVVGVEPHPKIFSYLCDNIRLNQLENVTLHNTALGQQEGATFFSDQRNDELNQIQTAEDGLKVPVTTLDRIAHNIESVALLKVDVEGFEKFVLLGGSATLRRTSCLYCEVYEKNFQQFHYTTKQLLQILLEYGFHLFINNGNQTIKPLPIGYLPIERPENIIAMKDATDFQRRTGWKIMEGSIH